MAAITGRAGHALRSLNLVLEESQAAKVCMQSLNTWAPTISSPALRKVREERAPSL